ncbi:uncharacterized protein LOC127082363 [Lathyrus oleraceus]|uniref:uncharacterized protein LOC127082363 n=1 Tax=Pisum sativum TaxID=3888 RepID=UPI0021D19DB2|nr:uncharacterized protein LOC127082363 [Pisum sativum]
MEGVEEEGFEGATEEFLDVVPADSAVHDDVFTLSNTVDSFVFELDSDVSDVYAPTNEVSEYDCDIATITIFYPTNQINSEGESSSERDFESEDESESEGDTDTKVESDSEIEYDDSDSNDDPDSDGDQDSDDDPDSSGNPTFEDGPYEGGPCEVIVYECGPASKTRPHRIDRFHKGL